MSSQITHFAIAILITELGLILWSIRTLNQLLILCIPNHNDRFFFAFTVRPLFVIVFFTGMDGPVASDIGTPLVFGPTPSACFSFDATRFIGLALARFRFAGTVTFGDFLVEPAACRGFGFGEANS